MVFAILAVSFTSIAAFTDDSSAEDATETKDPVSTVTTIASGQTLELTDTTFTGDGKYIIESGAKLLIPSKLKLTSDKSDATIIEMKEDSLIYYGQYVQPRVIESDIALTLNGTLEYSLDIKTLQASLNISKDGKFGIMGLEITGGDGIEFSIGITNDATDSSNYEISMDIPALSYKGEIKNQGMTLEATDIKMSATATIDIKDILAGNSKIDGKISISKLSAKAVDEDNNGIEAVMESLSATFNASVSKSEGIVATISASEKSAQFTLTSGEGGSIKSKVSDVKLEGKFSVGNIETDDISIAIDRISGEYATYSIGSVSVVSDAVLDGKTLKGSIELSDIEAKIKADIAPGKDPVIDIRAGIGSASADMSYGTDVSIAAKIKGLNATVTNGYIEAGFSEVSFKGTLPIDIAPFVIDDFKATDGKLRIDMTGDFGSDDYEMKNAEISVASFSITGDTAFSEGFSANGKGIKATIDDDHDTIVNVESLEGRIGYITDKCDYINFNAKNLRVAYDDGDIAAESLKLVVKYPSGDDGSIDASDFSIKDDVINGKITIKNMRDDFNFDMEFGSQADVTVENSYFDEVRISSYAKVNGTFLFDDYSEGIEFADGSELMIDDYTRGIIMTVTVENSAFKSATLALKDGFVSIPEHTDGVPYTVDASGKTATIDQGHGDVKVVANAAKYTVKYNDQICEVEMDEAIETVGAVPADGYYFAGWFDGISFSEGELYSLSAPGERTLTPVFAPKDVNYKTYGDSCVIDLGSAERLSLNLDTYNRIIDYMKKGSLTDLEIKNDNATFFVPYSALSTQNSTRAGDFELYFQIIPLNAQDQAVSDAIGGRPAYELNTNLADSTASRCAINYKLADGESADDLRVYSVNKYGRTAPLNSDVKDNGDGTATVTFRHLNSDDLNGVYISADGSGNSDSDTSLAAIAGLVAGVVIVAAIVVILMKRRSGSI